MRGLTIRDLRGDGFVRNELQRSVDSNRERERGMVREREERESVQYNLEGDEAEEEGSGF
jgi:hypothetical protein